MSHHTHPSLILLVGTILLFSSCEPPRRNVQPPLQEAQVGPREIAGVSLVPVHQGLLTRCKREARPVPFPVPCPRLLPIRQLDLLWCNGCQPKGEMFNLDGLFRGPVGYIGRGHGGSRDLHLVIAAFPAEENRVQSLCVGAEPAGRRKVRGHSGRWILCPKLPEPGFHSGHVILTWIEGSTRYVVSLHSQTEVNRRIATAIAQHLMMAA